ncbi:granzyme B(G,H)-like isoform X2 [Dromiciops gliroides]|uniref:granzyme B(G,H)-like isoform X2 n=1 Tax=Dromiciops gliroides TaxID=33562 RepID=UPI001CC35AE2|nr:granzyme B(G,H)-like isoform X2 [Dromiciops gliroides]
MHFLFSLLVTLLQSPGARAGEIIGGREAKPHSRPYMAYLKYSYKNEEGTCGAFLVREDFLLTAAHCWGSLINITLGAHNIKKSEKTQQQIPVLRAIPHKDYDNKTHNNDIMLLQLKKKAKLTRAVGLLALPRRKDRLRPRMRCIVAGWGNTRKKISSDTLQEVELKVREDHECKDKYPKYYNNSTEICAGDPKDQKASFRGDSGGPLVCDRVAQGIVSYGPKYGNNPRVYTRISSFLPWIRRTMKIHEY